MVVIMRSGERETRVHNDPEKLFADGYSGVKSGIYRAWQMQERLGNPVDLADGMITIEIEVIAQSRSWTIFG